MGNIKIGLGGIPTELDVNLLEERFGVPQIGIMIPYADIEKCIGQRKNTSRFWTVTNAWRKKLFKQHNLVTKAIKNEGFEFLDSHKRVTFSVDKMKGGLRKVGRAAWIAVSTNRAELSQEEIKACDHVQNVGAMVNQRAAIAARKLTYEVPEKQSITHVGK